MRASKTYRPGAWFIVYTCIFMAGSAAAGKVEMELKSPARGFISSKPARTWEEGLISGNGTIGANVFGRVEKETVIFTHERLFLPKGGPVMPPDNANRLFEIRRLIDRGLYKQATQLQFDLSGQDGFMYPDPFIPGFDMGIKMETQGKISGYARGVNFETGETIVHWKDKRGAFERRLFVSRPDGLAVMSVSASGKGMVSFRLELSKRQPSDELEEKSRKRSESVYEKCVAEPVIKAEGGCVTFHSDYKEAYPGSIHALEGVAMVSVRKGSVSVDGDALVVKGADSALVMVCVEPVYDPDKPLFESMKKKMKALPADYDRLLEPHHRVHGRIFGRMKLDLGGGAEHKLTSEELIAKSTNENPSRALIEKEFDAGRYNILSCVGELPPNLQGVWAGIYSPPWASDFTQNGNVPSAIASIMNGNMAELMPAYTTYIESLVPYLEINAKNMFGARGIVLPSRTSATGFNNALAPRFAGGFWVAGAAWAAHFFYDYYLYTGDVVFLKEHALPFMEKALVFFEDYLYEGPDGIYVFSPTQSPENGPSNTRSQGTFNATMTVAACRELIENTIGASKKLRVNKDRIDDWEVMLEKLPPYLIGSEGTVKEWCTPKLHDQLGHRHSSQLYALYDGLPDEIAADEKVKNGFKRIIEIKLDKHWKRSGFMSFGVVQLGQAATSLGEGELAYRCLMPLVNHYWLGNMASMHNPKSLFNMDISGGMPAVIIKMFMDSYPGRIRLLPALPSAWPEGEISGIACRGQIEIVRLNWAPDRVKVVLRSEIKQAVKLELPAEIKSARVVKGGASLRSREKNSRVVKLPAGEEIELELVLAR